MASENAGWPDAALIQQRMLARRAARASVFTIALLLICSMFLKVTNAVQFMAAWTLYNQDLWLLLAMFCIAIASALFPARNWAPFVLSRRGLAVLAVLVASFCYVGRQTFLEGQDFVRDEQLVAFDGWIYAHGRLVWPLPPQWQPYTAVLNDTFLYPVGDPVAWVSTYLPGNALLHGLVGRVADPALAAPVLAALSLPLMWSCARRIWPDDREAATIAVLVLALSGQVLVTAMTTWAMTAHLFFNLLWLRLFLNDRRATDMAAIVVGAFSTGLHQPLFHPLFVAPFLLRLLVERRWARLALFVLGYLAIGLFWLAWPHLIHGLISGPLSHDSSASTDYVARLLATVVFDTNNLGTTGANLLRFVTWQHVAMLPLLFAAWPAVRRGRLAATLALCVGMTIVVVAIIVPAQGHGYGFRYVHAVLGAVALLAGYGWRELGALRPRLRVPFAVATIGTVLIMLPAELVMTHRMVAANAQASRTIDSSGAEYALIEREGTIGYGNLIYNRPDLSNRPLRLIAEHVPDHVRMARMICRRGARLAMPVNSFFRPGAAYFGMKPADKADAALARLRGPYEAAGCTITLLR